MKKIQVQKLTKKFSISCEQNSSVFSTLADTIFQKEHIREHIALEKISFDVKNGEVLGIIGNNGAGKSTLLKVLAGIFEPTLGTVILNGGVLFVGGVSKGFPPKLTVKEIIFLIGTMLGLSQKDIKEKYSDIISFAELEDYTGTKIYQLSRGMVHRLTFSVIIHSILYQNPDIVLLDEVFSKGGDVQFREKAHKKMKEFIDAGATVLLVSHNLDVVKRYASRVLWLEQGKLVADGNTENILARYRAANF